MASKLAESSESNMRMDDFGGSEIVAKPYTARGQGYRVKMFDC